MKNLNKWLLAFACAVLCCTVTACGDDDDNNSNGNTTITPTKPTSKQFQYLLYTSTDMIAAADVEVSYTDLATGQEVKRVLTADDNSFNQKTDFWGNLWASSSSHAVYPYNFEKTFRFATPPCAVGNGTAYKITATIKANKAKMENFSKNNEKFYYFSLNLSAYLDNSPATNSTMITSHTTFTQLDKLEEYLQEDIYNKPETLSETATW